MRCNYILYEIQLFSLFLEITFARWLALSSHVHLGDKSAYIVVEQLLFDTRICLLTKKRPLLLTFFLCWTLITKASYIDANGSVMRAVYQGNCERWMELCCYRDRLLNHSGRTVFSYRPISFRYVHTARIVWREGV